MLKGKVLVAQGGGPTAVINQSLVGFVTEALKQECITRVLGMRHGIKGLLAEDLIDLGKETAGRNMPHGVFVDNIGLNGLLIVENESERQFFITAAPWVPEQTRRFFLKATADGGQCSLPAILHVRRKAVASAGD